MQLARCAGVEEHVNAGEPFAHGQLMDGGFFGPATGGDFRNTAIERILELRHRLDVLCIVHGDLGAGRKLNRVPAVTAIARFAGIFPFCCGGGLHHDKPASAKRGGAQKAASTHVAGRGALLFKSGHGPLLPVCEAGWDVPNAAERAGEKVIAIFSWLVAGVTISVQRLVATLCNSSRQCGAYRSLLRVHPCEHRGIGANP
jgi:hypothetical protein